MMKQKDWSLYVRQAEVLKALAHPIRVAIVQMLRDGERCVCEIAPHVDCDRTNISKHLAIMTRAGILTSRKQGLQVFYSLGTPCVANFLSCAVNTLKKKAAEDAKALANLG